MFSKTELIRNVVEANSYLTPERKKNEIFVHAAEENVKGKRYDTDKIKNVVL